MASPLANAPFSTITLSREVPGDGDWTTDGYGNPVPPAGEAESYTAFFAPFKAGQLEHLPGADVTVLYGKGELKSPTTFADDVAQGTTFATSYGGRDWTLEITNLITNDLAVADFGTYFEAVLRLADG